MSRRRRPESKNLRILNEKVSAGVSLTQDDWEKAVSGLSARQQNFIEKNTTLRELLQRSPTQAELACALGVTQKSVSEMHARIQQKLPGLLLVARSRASKVYDS